MSKFYDIRNVLDIISAENAELAFTNFKTTGSSVNVENKIKKLIKSETLNLEKSIARLEVNMADPMDVIYENYWQVIIGFN